MCCFCAACLAGCAGGWLGRLASDVSALNEELSQHTQALRKVQALESTLNKYNADLSSGRAEHAKLQEELEGLRAQVNEKLSERTQVRVEVADLKVSSSISSPRLTIDLNPKSQILHQPHRLSRPSTLSHSKTSPTPSPPSTIAPAS